MSGTIYKIQHRRGTMSEWSTVNPILGDGEIGKVVGTSLAKMGDGLSAWLDLPYLLTQDDLAGIGTTFAPINSPAFTGTPTSPTPSIDDNDTSVATTAFVMGQAGATAPVMDGAATSGTSKRWSRQDHRHPQDTGLLKKSGDFATGPLGIMTADGIAMNFQAASLRGITTNMTGYLILTMPQAPGQSCMMQLALRGYDYSDGGGEFRVDLGGYLYQATPAWARTSARMSGRFSNSSLGYGRKTHRVRFLHKGAPTYGQFAIAIGEADSLWNYTQLTLEIIAGYSGYIMADDPGYSITISPDLTGWTTDFTEESPPISQNRVPLPGEARILSMGTQSIPNNVSTPVTGFGIVTGDKSNGATTIAGGTVTLEESGYWDVSLYIGWATSPSGVRQSDICVNGVAAYRDRRQVDSLGYASSTVAMISNYWTKGTVLSIEVLHNAGSPLSINSGRFNIRRVGEYY